MSGRKTGHDSGVSPQTHLFLPRALPIAVIRVLASFVRILTAAVLLLLLLLLL